ncbi:MAG: glycosyltransferase [Elusimicrobia bacterium]|nr:glycosyltransferase [Elusimicrobiota bacterium]
MKLLLVPDPTSPNGEDAFCREIAKRAGLRGHETAVQAVPNGPLEASLSALSASGFAADCELVVINSLQPAALLAAKAAGRKTAVRLIDSYAAAAPPAIEEVKRLALQADLILVPSQHMARMVQAWGCNGSVKQVPYAYDRIMAQQIALVTIRASKPVFSLVAVHHLDESSRPGLESLFSAMARLRIDCHLAVVGAGPAQPALKARAQQLVISDKVSFHEPMPHAKLMEFFRAAKAYIDPCGLDGFPTLALYALSEGCPVIAARAGAASELISDGRNGLMFNPGDAGALSEAIVTLWSVRGLSLRLIAEGIKTVGAHSWDNTVSAVFEAVESLK